MVYAKGKSPTATGVRGMRLKGPDRYELRVYLGEDEGGRKKIYSEVFHGGKKDAEARLAELKKERGKGALSVSPKLTVKELLDRWFAEYVEAGVVRPDTVTWYKMHLERNILPYIGSRQVKKLTPQDITRLYANLKQTGKSPTIQAGAHRTLRAAFNWGERQGLIGNNPISKVTSPKPVRPDHPALSLDEVKSLLRVILEKYTRYYPLILLALTTGMRESEILGLMWADVDFLQRTIRVTHQIKGEGNKATFADVKTSSGKRTISLSDRDIELLQEQKHYQEKVHADSPPYRDLGLVFALDNGNPIPRKNLSKSLKLALQQAGITKPFTFHSLRRTSATLIYLKDPNIRMIQERLGHSEVRTTLSYYTGVVPGHQEKAAANLANLLFGEDHP